MELINEEPVVILAGGLGTRLREETEFKPKPMVNIGSKPIIWHIMKIYSSYGYNNFIICAGYKKEYIKDYFLNFYFRNYDIEINLGEFTDIKLLNKDISDKWNIKIVDTGDSTPTGGRLKRIEHLISTENFLCTYGDGLANVKIDELVRFHKSSPTIGTLTAVRPAGRFGVLAVSSEKLVEEFAEKPNSDTYINGGFFVFNREIFKHLDFNSVLEQEPLENLALLRELKAFSHNGFWQPMDTYREFELLNNLWNTGGAPWKTW